jgi:hypothetical protein
MSQEDKTTEDKGLVEPVTDTNYKSKLVEMFRAKKAITSKSETRIPKDIAQMEISEAIGAVSPGSAVPEIWTSEVERLYVYGRSVFLGANFVAWKRDIDGQPGDTLNIPTINTITAIQAESGTEGTITAAAVSSVPVTLVEFQAGYYMSKANTEDVVVGTVDALDEGLGDAIARKVDEYFLGQIMAASIGGTLDSSATAAGTLIAKLIGSMEAGTYSPSVFITHPVPYASLLADSQFTDASTWGDRGVLLTGRIPNYLGVDILKVNQGTLLTATGGTYKSFLVADRAIGAAMKRGLDMESEYYVKDQKRYTLASIRLGGTVVHTSGVWMLTTVNG